MEQETDLVWQQLSQQILTDIKEWRQAYPSATLREIEQEVYRRMSRLEAQIVQDSALASPMRDWSGVGEASRPKCPVCQTPKPRTRKEEPPFTGGGRRRHHPDKNVWNLPWLWDRVFSPSMRS